MTDQDFSFETKLLHNQHKFDPATGGVSVPIQHASTFHQSDIDQFGKYDYSRSGNPTREALEDIIAELEEGTTALPFIRYGCHFNSLPAIVCRGSYRHFRRCVWRNVQDGHKRIEPFQY